MFMRTPIYRTGDGVVFGLRQQVVFQDATDQIYVVPPAANSKLWLVAELFYGVQELWWVISEVNNILDPLVSVPAGTQLRIPRRERLADQGILTV